MRVGVRYKRVHVGENRISSEWRIHQKAEIPSDIFDPPHGGYDTWHDSKNGAVAKTCTHTFNG